VIEFIFMLTRDDETLADARDVYASIASTGSTCSPTATTATSRRSCAQSSAPPTCR